MVWGEGVEEPERFTNILETLQPSWRIDNLGMTGFGPDLMLRALEEVGLKFQSDVVIFSIYTDDLRRVHPYYYGMGFWLPRYSLESGKLVSIPYPSLNIFQRTHLFQVFHKQYWKVSRMEYKLTETILLRFIELSNRHHFVPAIIFLPGRLDEVPDKERRQWLGLFAKERGVPFLDLTAPIFEVSRNEAFIEENYHFNPNGHKIVAGELHRFLMEKVIKYLKHSDLTS
jgi:hypothetical protein